MKCRHLGDLAPRICASLCWDGRDQCLHNSGEETSWRQVVMMEGDQDHIQWQTLAETISFRCCSVDFMCIAHALH